MAWFGIAVLAVANGAARDVLYQPFTGELAAHQISTVVLLCIIGGAAWFAQSRWPLASRGEAAAVGAAWAAQTITFECAVGRVLAGKPWDVVLHDDNVVAGRIWVLIPLWLLAAPSAVFRAKSGGEEPAR